ncbi:ATP-binding protein [Rufibacter glacialis]|uniref:histidine kinase n=1 Tax=Rufibacter glacialis TaxID=1259555 RepID=A0A5M8QAL5_9BACT|nr:PAS domain-containing sensor histidine kinase [Rufibacter glacialis]KAA6431856.1 PAS domain-containing protein [Rufibacter glacialis]GGK80973.1 hypothetical protein GCM10011405_30920 [Rufibacter glacialis]
MPSTNLPPDFYEALIERTGQAFFAFDLGQLRLVYQNSAFEAAFKVPEGTSTQQEWLEVVHPEDRNYVVGKLPEVLASGVCHSLEFRVQLPGQPGQWVCLSASVVEKGDGQRLLVGHVEDVTTQRKYNDHLKKFSNKKNSVLNILAHDLAGPLGMIHNLSGLLTDQLKALEEEESQKTIALIERISKHGSTILRDFMNHEFLESSQTDLVTRRVNVTEKVREALEEYLGEKGRLMDVRFEFQYSHEEIFVDLDDLKFLQVITNLISNSLKFTPPGGVITISLEKEETTFLVKVADTGVGIPKEFHEHLFEKFTKARRPGLKGEQSVGLGMSIVKTIVDWHKGDIWLESEENKGTTFFLRLPKVQIP